MTSSIWFPPWYNDNGNDKEHITVRGKDNGNSNTCMRDRDKDKMNNNNIDKRLN